MMFTKIFAQETFTSVEDLYARVLNYYGLAQEEHEKGEYIKSYEYSQLANGLFVGSSKEIYMQLANLMLNDLEQSVRASIENLDGGESVDNYDSIVNSYDAGKELHDKFNTFTTDDDTTLIQTTFEDARDYYLNAQNMINGNNSDDSKTIIAEKIEPTRPTDTQNTSDSGSENSIDEANTKYLYLTRNNIITTRDTSYKPLTDNINKMNSEKSSTLADENIKTMDMLILDNDIKKMFDYAEKGVDKANTMGSSVLDSDKYKNILATIETAKSQYANDEKKLAAKNIATALSNMESECAILKKLPQTYTVVKHSNASLTDSFWRISGYDFIYADREKWPTLYDANQDKVKYRGNPRVIEPGTVFNVRSLTNEPREGHYNSSELYIPITVYYYLDDSTTASSDSADITNVSDDSLTSNSNTDADTDSDPLANTESNDSLLDDSENNSAADTSLPTDIESDDSAINTTDDVSDGVINVIDKDDLGEDGQSSSGISVQSF